MKYLVTGGAGFIGSHLIELLLEKNNDIICVDDLSSGYLSNLPEAKTFIFRECDVRDLEDSELEKINGIFHLAAQASVPFSIDNFFQSSTNNLLTSIYLFEIAKRYKIPMVYASSSSIYGNLSLGNDEVENYDILSPYALDKLTIESYAKMCWEIFNVSSIGLRFFNVYGPKQDPKNPYSGVISIFIDRLLNDQPIIVNGGYQTRDFIFVKDIARVMNRSMNFLQKNKIFETFNVGTGKSVDVNDLLGLISKIMNKKPKIILKKLKPEDPEKSSGTYNKLENILNMNNNDFITLKKGLATTINFIEKSYQQ